MLNGRLSFVGSMPLRTQRLRDIALIVGDVLFPAGHKVIEVLVHSAYAMLIRFRS